MTDNFQKRTSSFILTALIGIIVISFMFSGYERMTRGSSPDTIATVGDTPIKIREFQMEYQRQVQFFGQIFGGNEPLSQSQIEQFGIKDKALGSLINNKRMLNLASKIGIEASEEEIKTTVKELPYFKDGSGNFDKDSYKRILAANRLTPVDFENDMANDIKLKKFYSLTKKTAISKDYAGDLEKFRSQKLPVQAIKLTKENMRSFIDVSDSEVQTFLSKKENEEKVKAIFAERKPGLDQKPDGKKPLVEAQYEDFRKAIAIETIQKMKAPEEINKKVAEMSAKLKNLLEVGNEKELTKMSEQFKFKYLKDATINRLEGLGAEFELSTEQIKQLFLEDVRGKINDFSDPANIIIVKTTNRKIEKAKDDTTSTPEQNLKVESMALSRKISEEIQKSLEDAYKVKVFNNFSAN